MANATWEQRAKTLNKAGYAHYDEPTASMLGGTTEDLLDRYGGDLRKLRREAERGPQPQKEQRLPKDFECLGGVGVDIFFAEAQAASEELYPFADEGTPKAARKLDLGGDADTQWWREGGRR